MLELIPPMKNPLPHILALLLAAPFATSQEVASTLLVSNAIGKTNSAEILNLIPNTPTWAAVGGAEGVNRTLFTQTGDPRDILGVRDIRKGQFLYLGQSDATGRLEYEFTIPDTPGMSAMNVYIQVWSENPSGSGDNQYERFSYVVLLKPNYEGEWRDNEEALPNGLVHSAHVVLSENQWGGAEEVLICGGAFSLFQESTTPFEPTNEAWIWNTNTETLTPVDPMPIPLAGHTATRMDDGRVLVVGGVVGSHGDAATGYKNIVSPTALIFEGGGGNGSWDLAGQPAMSTPRVFHESVLLDDGRVLVIGGANGGGVISSFEDAMGEGLTTTEIYDPLGNGWGVYWFSGPDLPGQTVGGGVVKSATQWPNPGNHQILIAGGFEDGVVHGNLYGIDALATLASSIGSMDSRALFSIERVERVGDDNAIFVGGGFTGDVVSGGAGLTVLNTTQLYKPSRVTGWYRFVDSTDLPLGLAMGTAVQGLHHDKKIYIAGGVDQFRSGGSILMTFNPDDETTESGRTSNQDHGGGIVVMVGNGAIGVVGGAGSTASSTEGEKLTP